MGLRGPAPTPAGLKRRNLGELSPTGEIPSQPKLSAEAAAEWRRIVGILGPRGALSGDLDRASLTLLCESWAMMTRCQAALAEARVGSKTWIHHTRAYDLAWRRWTDLSKRYGLTPADRPRVKLAKPDTKLEHGEALINPILKLGSTG